jgi:hypothetical protein
MIYQSQATENALKQLQSPKILHIATHGFFLNNVPLVAPPDFSGSLFQEGAFNQIPPTSGNTENPLLRSLNQLSTALSEPPQRKM